MVDFLDQMRGFFPENALLLEIDSHELQGLDVVQYAASVETNHGIVNLIMNEYACYGKGPFLWTD